MSAHEQMRAMLDQLMGTGRDGENNKFKVHFSDPRVCKSFLLACCPHDILAATRMDLGECAKIHDLALRADYTNATATKDYFYDVDAMEHLQNFINDCDRRTEQAKRRLAETQEELSAEVAAKLNRVHELAEQIGKKLAQAEKLGADGNVEESMKTMEEVEDCRKQKAVAEQEYRNSMPASSYQQQKLRVCEVCSAYLGIHDNDRRLADHFGGKLHLGFIAIRERLQLLKSEVNEKRKKGQVERDLRDREEYCGVGGGREWSGRGAANKGDAADKERSRDRDRERPPPPHRRRSHSSSRDRARRHRSRSKSGDRTKHRRRSRSRERRAAREQHHRRHRRERSREKPKRSRSRERSRKSSEKEKEEDNNHGDA